MKGIAIPYIIAILLGVAVIGLVGYWLFVSGGRFGTATDEQTCRTALAQWCSQFAANGYSGVWFADNKFTEINNGKNEPCNVKYSLVTETNVDVAKASCLR